MDLAKQGTDIGKRIVIHNRKVEENIRKYKLAVERCENAEKAKSRSQLAACIEPLAQAGADADKGDLEEASIAKEAEVLKARASRHNQRCALYQVRFGKP